MVFSSFIFIFGFLPVFWTLYLLTPRLLKNPLIVVASFAFYAWGAPEVAPLLLIGSLGDYYLVRLMLRDNRKWARPLCALGVTLNLLFLGYFKYANFFVSHFPGWAADWQEIVLPIGISFFTFQKISYILDVYRSRTPAARSALEYLLYVTLFPQLIAGPIIRYSDIQAQIRQREHSVELAVYGIVRFIVGLAKKILLADAMGAVADNAFSLGPEGLSTSYAWIGALAYAFQIYFDFSGYSDMAIGLCAMMGFRIPENFCMPYAARSISEFWRRWHISLSSWMREYLYIPLGGNRGSMLRTACNLWIVFLLSGLWHGASWTFIAWGAFHGLFLSLERVFAGRFPLRVPAVLALSYTWLVLLCSWVLFRAETFAEAAQYFQALVGLTEASNPPALSALIHPRGRVVMLVCVLLVVLSTNRRFAAWVQRQYQYPLSAPTISFALSYALFFLAILALASSVFNPFIYYRF